MKKKIKTYFYILIISSLVCLSYFIYKRHELSNYYYKKLNTWNRIILLDEYKSRNLDAIDIWHEELEKIKNQMYQDGYNRAEISKMDAKAFLKAEEQIENIIRFEEKHKKRNQ